MRIFCLQHVRFEGPGCIERWAADNNYSFTLVKLFENEPFPDVGILDMLVVMGGPMSVSDDGEFSWLKREKQFIRQVVDADKPVVGICLGAQLIAIALGAGVYQNKVQEIGWFPVKICSEAKTNPLLHGFPEEITVFHWHGDTFDIPQGAERLFRSEVTPNQAFLYNQKVLGLQFHFEVDSPTLQIMSEFGMNDLKKGDFVQDKQTILNTTQFMEQNNRLIEMMLDRIKMINC